MASLKPFTTKAVAGVDLSAADVAIAVQLLLDDAIRDDDKAEFLVALARKGESAAEIAAFARQLRALAVDPGIDPARFDGVLLDVCGTGADMAHTFNISSCVMFIAAAAGVAVAKHGNRAITSRCGSADVLTALGANIELAPDAARRCLEQTGVTFFFAPAYHPAFKTIAPVRKKLAERNQRTVFNILGPLVNPARPTHQLIGIFDRALVERYIDVLRLLELRRAVVVHGDGLDEFTTLGENTAAELRDGRVSVFHVRRAPTDGPRPTLADLAGGDPAVNAQIVRDILAGAERGARRDIVALNAAVALMIAGKAPDFETAWHLACQLIASGAAREKLEQFVAASREP
jgi:anthranilate phosphoribosyltransferase